jgi:steroid 5-alpha reductase family enzyme
MSFIQILAAAATITMALSMVMTVAWLVQQRSGNSGWVDVFWTFGTGGVAAAASLVPLTGAMHARQILVAGLATLWSLRLGWHIAVRTNGIGDDPRYRQMAEAWGADAPRQMFWLLQKQAIVSVPLAIAIVLAAHNPHPQLGPQDLLGTALLIFAIVGEKMADDQLRRFRADPANHNAVCDSGLWRWSRHPNYFFEWLGWLAYPLIAIDLSGANPYGWLALLAPACMYWLLVHISGIPPLEAHMLRSRGEAFRSYQRRTRAFFPLPMIPKN